MSNIYAILDVGKGAILTQRLAINVTGHNISNVNTEGYSRQRVNTATRRPLSSQPGQVGTGVEATEVQRIYDRFIGGQINDAGHEVGRWDARKRMLERVETVFDESGGYGLNLAMSEFWNAWQDLSNNPSGQSERLTLVAKSGTLVDTFSRLDEDLTQIQRNIDAGVKDAVDRANAISEQITDLNEKIRQAEVVGQSANDYRDKRDLLHGELASIIDINGFEKSNGELTLFTAGGRPLVEGSSAWNLSAQVDPVSGLLDVVWIDGDGNHVEITETIAGGELKGLLESREGMIADYMSKLDTLAGTIIDEVNTIHTGGIRLDGLAGEVFFTGSTASDMALSQNIVDDSDKIAAAGALEGVPGGNGNAIEMANLQHKLSMNPGKTATFDEYYNALVSDMGADLRGAAVNFEHHSSTAAQMANFRESISGVSLEEEMVNLIKYQHAYDAAAKMITVVDEMLNSIISML
jgi:flagellar hook-associated protein 1 FlgK